MSDEHLRREFQKQREHDLAHAPAFDAMWRARPKRVSPWWLAAPIVPLASAAAFALWLSHEARTPSAARAHVPQPPVVVDSEPLAFLLESPSLTGMPDFDTSPIPKTK